MAGAQGMTLAREFEAFASAAINDNDVGGIETMMRLALHGQSPGIKRWAAQWLLERFGLTVCDIAA